MRKQFHRSALPGGQTERSRHERAIRQAFVNVPTTLVRCPGTAFYNAARRDNPSRPWASFLEPLRAAAIEAHKLGGPAIDETETKIVLACVALMECALEPLRARPVGDVAYLTLARDESAAIDAQSLARMAPTSENVARAVDETEHAMGAGLVYVASVERQREHRRPMGAA